MDFISECVDSPLSGNMSASTLSSIGETPPRGIEGLRRKLKIQQISSTKLSFFDRQPDSNDDMSSSKVAKSSTFKRKFNEQYTTMETIGQGSCGVVKKVQCNEDKKIYVAKIVRGRDSERIEQVKREFQMLSKFQHPNIIIAKELFLDEVTGNAQLILEYFQGQTLEDLIMERGQLEEEIVRRIVEQLISALKHVHDKGVCHRDITATNVLINENYEVKLIDFNVSKIYRQDLWSPTNKTPASLRKKSSPMLPNYHNFMLSNTGTPAYKAPEIVTCVPYNHSVDMWALGVVAFYALVGYQPFQSEYLDDLYDKISNADYNWDLVAWGNISYEAALFVKACLKQYPFVRLTTKEAFHQPWIKGIKLNLEECPKYKRPSEKCMSPQFRSPRKEETSRILKPRKSFVLDITPLS